MQHQGALGLHTQIIAEIGAGGGNLQRGIGIGPLGGDAGHMPVVNPRREGVGLRAGLTDAAACKAFGAEMALWRGQPGMAHPDLRAVPTFRVVGCKGGTEQRPLRAVVAAIRALQRGGQIPPFDAILRVRAVIARELQCAAAFGNGEPVCVGPKAREPLRQSGWGQKKARRSKP